MKNAILLKTSKPIEIYIFLYVMKIKTQNCVLLWISVFLWRHVKTKNINYPLPWGLLHHGGAYCSATLTHFFTFRGGFRIIRLRSRESPWKTKTAYYQNKSAKKTHYQEIFDILNVDLSCFHTVKLFWLDRKETYFFFFFWFLRLKRNHLLHGKET